MVKVELSPGICGLQTSITVTSEDMQMAQVSIQTPCQNIKNMADELEGMEIDAFAACLSKMGDSEIFERARKHCKHPSCPIVSAILKGIEVECGLALPQEAHIIVSKVNND